MLIRGHPDFAADAVYIALELVIAALAVAGNVLVMWAVILNSNLQNVTNYFVASLAAADVAVGVLAVPFAVTVSTGFCASFYGCLFIACFVLVLTQSSIFSLLAIAIDRFIAIRMPLRYNALVTASRAKGIIAVCWVLSFVIGLTPMLGWNRRPTTGNVGNAAPDFNVSSASKAASTNNCSANMVPCLFEGVVTMEYMVYYNFFACVLLPLLMMFAIYLKIFMAARRQLKQIGNKMAATSASAHGERSSSSSILQKEIHAAKSLAIIVGLFAVCWLPLHVVNCYTLFCRGCARPPLWLMYVAILLSHANSVVNPLIYAYRIREFRQTFRKILRGHVLRETAPPRCQTASVHGRENGERGTIVVDSYDGVLSKTGAERNGFDGGTNGEAGRHFYRNGAVSARKEEQFDESLLACHESLFTESETLAFDLSSVS